MKTDRFFRVQPDQADDDEGSDRCGFDGSHIGPEHHLSHVEMAGKDCKHDACEQSQQESGYDPDQGKDGSPPEISLQAEFEQAAYDDRRSDQKQGVANQHGGNLPNGKRGYDRGQLFGFAPFPGTFNAGSACSFMGFGFLAYGLTACSRIRRPGAFRRSISGSACQEHSSIPPSLSSSQLHRYT